MNENKYKKEVINQIMNKYKHLITNEEEVRKELNIKYEYLKIIYDTFTAPIEIISQKEVILNYLKNVIDEYNVRQIQGGNRELINELFIAKAYVLPLVLDEDCILNENFQLIYHEAFEKAVKEFSFTEPFDVYLIKCLESALLEYTFGKPVEKSKK